VIVSEESVTYQDYSLCDPNFIDGIDFLERGLYSQANHCFEVAYEQVTYSDIHYNKYASFCGYTRVLNGDRGGLMLCREVVANELYDADVYYNLAKSEWVFKNRKRTIDALLKGVDIDASHPGIRGLCKKMNMRKRAAIGFLPRSNVLNKTIGKLLRK